MNPSQRTRLAAAVALRPTARRSAALALAALLAAPFVAACLPGVCLVKTNINGKWSCALSTCANGSEFNVGANACLCREGLFSVQGQCLTQAQADVFCGSGNVWTATGCAARTCAKGQELDQGTGQCKDVAAVATAIGVELKPGETIGCPPGQRLVTEGDAAACVPIAQTCAPDERFDGNACAKAKSCPTGAALDPATGECVAFGSSGASSYAIDATSWAQSNYGKDGGMGTSAFCGGFAKRPWTFGVGEGQSAVISVKLGLAFPDGSAASGAVLAVPTFEGQPQRLVPKPGAEGVAKSAEDVLARLRAGGGTVAPKELTLTVRCAVVNAAKPAAVPAVGGV